MVGLSTNVICRNKKQPSYTLITS